MTTPVVPVLTATLRHDKASSACCGDLLQLPAPDAAHGAEFECSSCGQPTERFVTPVFVTATSAP